MLSQQEAKNIIDKAIGYPSCPAARPISYTSEDVFIRYANNGITTSGYRITQNLSISSVTADKRHGNAVVNELSEEAIKHGVEQAEAQRCPFTAAQSATPIPVLPEVFSTMVAPGLMVPSRTALSRM